MQQKVSIVGTSRVLAVASGKGGVGKTTVTVNLALALLQSGNRVGLFDADLYGPNIPLILGARRSQPSQGFIPIKRRSRVPYIQPLRCFGLEVMSIGFVVGDSEAVTPDPASAGDIIRQTLEDVVWGELDYLLVDFPPGTGEPQQTLLKMIHFDGVLVVTTPQDLSLMDSSRSVNTFRQSGVPVIGVVENMSYLDCPHCGKAIEVFSRSKGEWLINGVEVPQLGRIPLNPTLSRNINSEHPLLHPDTDASEFQVFKDIAAKVASYFTGSNHPTR